MYRDELLAKMNEVVSEYEGEENIPINHDYWTWRNLFATTKHRPTSVIESPVPIMELPVKESHSTLLDKVLSPIVKALLERRHATAIQKLNEENLSKDKEVEDAQHSDNNSENGSESTGNSTSS